jgi:hypothetical protein
MFLAEIAREYGKNPEFRARIDRILEPGPAEKNDGQRGRRSRNKRPPAAVDPYREYTGGEGQLLRALEPLTIEQLKDIVSEYAMDSSRLALKWKNKDRLIDLIRTTVRNRIQKGDVFRDEGKGEDSADGDVKAEGEGQAKGE